MADFDIVIVGGGLTGLALLNKIVGKKVLLIDNSLNQQPKSRPLMLTSSNAKWLGFNKGWPIDIVKVTSKNRLGVLKFVANEFGLIDFGFVVDALELQTWLQNGHQARILSKTKVLGIEQTNDFVMLKLDSGENVKAKQIIAADGSNSTISENIKPQKIWGSALELAVIPNVGIFYDVPAQLRFIKHGTIAFLPTGNNIGTIVASGAAVDSNMKDIWQQHLPISDIKYANKVTYTNESFYLQSHLHGNIIFTGNAAHTLPPIGAQGFNLSCKNIRILSDFINQNRPLIEYETLAQNNVKATFNICNQLTNNNITSSFLAGFGLSLINQINLIKSEILAITSQDI